MTIYKTAYDTTACSGFRVKDTQDKLEKGSISGALRHVTIKTNHAPEGFALSLLEGGNSAADVIPYFHHPMVMPYSKLDNPELQFAVDVRNFGKWYAPNEVFVVRNRPEYDWNIKRAILNYIWMTERPEILRDVSTIPLATYAMLVSECVARRFALDPLERIKIQVLAAFFYLGLFVENRELGEMERGKMVGVISRVTRVPAERVFEYVGDIPLMTGLVDFCEAAKTLTQSVALSDFNVGVLVAITSGTWYGTNARGNLAVGLEPVPTWLMTVAASLDEATFKRSTLAKISMQFDKAGAGDNFLKSLNVLMGGPDVVASQVSKTE